MSASTLDAVGGTAASPEADVPAPPAASPSSPPASALVPREEQAAVIAAALAAVRRTEGERRWGVAIARLAPWGGMALMVVPLAYCLSIIKNRPVPQDRIHVAVMHSDGSVEPSAKPVEDMTATERENAATQFMFDYVDYRVSYTWASVQRNYDRTRYLTFGDAQKEYIEAMTVRPDRPTETLGQSGEKRVKVTSVERTGPRAFEVGYTLSVKDPHGVTLPDVRRRVGIAYGIFPGLPAEIARRFDPLKIVVTQWNDRPAAFDPAAPGGAR